MENKDLYNQIIFNNNSIIDTLTTMPIDFTILIKVKDEENQQDLSTFPELNENNLIISLLPGEYIE